VVPVHSNTAIAISITKIVCDEKIKIPTKADVHKSFSHFSNDPLHCRHSVTKLRSIRLLHTYTMTYGITDMSNSARTKHILFSETRNVGHSTGIRVFFGWSGRLHCHYDYPARFYTSLRT